MVVMMLQQLYKETQDAHGKAEWGGLTLMLLLLLLLLLMLLMLLLLLLPLRVLLHCSTCSCLMLPLPLPPPRWLQVFLRRRRGDAGSPACLPCMPAAVVVGDAVSSFGWQSAPGTSGVPAAATVDHVRRSARKTKKTKGMRFIINHIPPAVVLGAMQSWSGFWRKSICFEHRAPELPRDVWARRGRRPLAASQKF
jgi:hypothetical protein